MWADEAALDAATRRLDEWESSLADRAARAQALSARTRALTGSARSPDRAVEVTVDATGLLVDLRLDEQTRQHPAAHTARQIVATTRAAHADLLRQLTEATTQTLGDDDPAGRAIIDGYRRRLAPGQGPPDGRR
ncbi:YbaB/EbfC family nucleoid-associated protein [Micromonospora sp. WMMD956]|uniref:YbaB/EbfC family nucleoid-associated protein n=1 Tax=Micromonospora sp. WMMD956 TaxID=3016108 RepID=UPI002416BF89|nr:YbaB/EbfC family nucleoid-associated protein [Micromonospora sp. WMMD956]MDG4818926.1 YbaB/EbfC family nucleoid-associated protein [Micromonospora sp. WMMD956]